jgi:hypothetical protein
VSSEPVTVVQTGKLDLPAGECAACASPATHFVDVRGDAGIRLRRVNVCARHESMARGSTYRFLKHVDTKESFLDDPDAAKEEVRRRIERERS